MKINKITVVGTGYMGLGLTQLIAKAGYHVTLKSRSSNNLKKGLTKIEKTLQRDLEAKRISQKESTDIQTRIVGTTSLTQASTSDLIIEAIIENFEAKSNLFKEFDLVCPQNTIFASNTSSLSITEMARSCGRPDRFIGLHFFNPPAKMKLVEVVKGSQTSIESINVIIDFVNSINKNPISVNDSPGFLVNRLLFPMINEAINALGEGIASRDDIDASMRLGANHPMGPLELADLIGLDVCLEILDNLYKKIGDKKYLPCPLLKRMVEQGYLGKKTGRGFYTYKIT